MSLYTLISSRGSAVAHLWRQNATGYYSLYGVFRPWLTRINGTKPACKTCMKLSKARAPVAERGKP